MVTSNSPDKKKHIVPPNVTFAPKDNHNPNPHPNPNPHSNQNPQPNQNLHPNQNPHPNLNPHPNPNPYPNQNPSLKRSSNFTPIVPQPRKADLHRSYSYGLCPDYDREYEREKHQLIEMRLTTMAHSLLKTAEIEAEMVRNLDTQFNGSPSSSAYADIF
jgi:hypothetical protein